jgi:hypothetical protein
MTLHEQITKLNDIEAERCLNMLVKQVAEANPDLQSVLSSPTLAAEAVQRVGAQTGAESLSEAAIKNRPGAIRAILQEASNDPVLAPRLEAWLSGPRKLLFEPITTTLILAGVVVLLSTHVKIEYEQKDGKKHIKVAVEKKGSSQSIIQKVLSFARVGGK